MLLARPITTRHRFSCLVLVAMACLLSACLQNTPAPAPARQYETISAPAFNKPAVGKVQSAQPVTVKRTVKVAMLLPLSGRNAELGRALQNAATMALFDRYAALSPQLAATKVEILPKDTGDTAESARSAAEEAVAEGAALMIGPIFSDAVQAVTPVAQQADIPVISFSNNPSVAKPGVYIFGFSPEAQTARVMEFALEQSREYIAAMVPNSPYGKSVLQAANATLSAQDQALVAQSVYEAQGVGMDTAIDTLIPPGTSPRFNTLFLPEGSNVLDTILRTLDARGVRSEQQVQLLGTGLWDDAALIRRVNLEGAWFASSPPRMTSAFEQRFRNTYRYAPPRIASLSYDAVSLAVTLATSGRTFDEKSLTHPSGFSGPANGIFRFLKNGTSERGLAVLQVRGGTFEVLSPAPTAFKQ
jgi:ABC-type branched-subunit amino acid transport system substrate-binding protein